MRHEAGLLLPERRIGLSAHDFQQAIAAREVVLTRAIRDAESETVPSRWLNRLTNLMQGCRTQGAAALDGDAGARGELAGRWPSALERRPRESPRRRARRRARRWRRGPSGCRSPDIKRWSATPTRSTPSRSCGCARSTRCSPSPDAPLRGTILHEVMERFVSETAGRRSTARRRRDRLMAMADARCWKPRRPGPRPGCSGCARAWRGVADWFLADEADRRAAPAPVATRDARRAARLTALDFTLTAQCRPDRP